MRKAPEAFRTISEAAEALDTPAHVLRFWESKFTQVKPVKRAGGRRYYRPADIDLLSGIKLLLHEQGMTIRGVQKLLQEKGARHVAAMAPLSGDLVEAESAPLLRLVPTSPEPEPQEAPAPELPALPGLDSAAAAPELSFMAEDEPLAAEATGDASPGTEGAPEDAPPLPAETATATAHAEQPAPSEPADALPVSEDVATAPVNDLEDDALEDLADADQPALAALLDAAAGQPAPPLRFAKIAHTLRTTPQTPVPVTAATLAKLEALVAKLTARAG